jgi:hypothetical protein
MDEPFVTAISVTLGHPTTFVLAPRNSPDRERVESSSLIIQNALLPALLSGAKPVRLDLESGNVIQRVQFFALGDGPTIGFVGNHIISRIATQRGPNGTADHLEVALKKIGDNEETAFNIFSPFLQQILIAAFRSPPKSQRNQYLPVAVQIDGTNIVSVTLGEKVST